MALTFGEPVMKLARPRRARGAAAAAAALRQRDARLVAPGTGPERRGAAGLFFGRIAPHRNDRRTFETPALVLGHRRDPVHPFSDAGMLADELPNARLLEANSIVELRMQPERLTNEIAAFVDQCWDADDAGSASDAAVA